MTLISLYKVWTLGNVESVIRLFIVVKNQNFQAYLRVFFSFDILRCPVDLAFQSAASRFPLHISNDHIASNETVVRCSICEVPSMGRVRRDHPHPLKKLHRLNNIQQLYLK